MKVRESSLSASVLEILGIVRVLPGLEYLPFSVAVAPSLSQVLQILLEKDSSQQLLQVQLLEIVGPELLIPAVPLALRHWLRYHLDYPDSGSVHLATLTRRMPRSTLGRIRSGIVR